MYFVQCTLYSDFCGETSDEQFLVECFSLIDQLVNFPILNFSNDQSAIKSRTFVLQINIKLVENGNTKYPLHYICRRNTQS